MDASVFREYDIRGLVDKEITDTDVMNFGKAFGTYMGRQGKNRVVVGRDCRLSSERYRNLLIQGMVSTGMYVTDVGVCPTPVMYFALRHLERQGGVMITASHNPPEYNGFKVCNGFDTISGPEILKLRLLMEEGSFESGEGSVETYDIIEPYKNFIFQNIRINRKLRVGIDGGNAAAGPLAVPILEGLGCEVHPIYCDMDGTFPNHEPDPTVMENLEDLRALVQSQKLDLGIGYDGDGDRLGVVDHMGKPVFGDMLMVIFAREILSRKPGSVFVSEVKCSKTLYDDIEKHGGKAVMWRTGHSLIKAKMKEVRAELAGEMSGHMFFSDRYLGFDDGIYASCRILEILAATGKTIPELLEGIPPMLNTPEIRVECPEEIKFAVVEKARDMLQEQRHSIIDVDGVRVVFEDGWGLLRASNTQPVLVLRYEARTSQRLEEIRELMEGVVDRAKKDL